MHAFAGDDRGAHLASLLERLGSLCGRDIQRIGLSATVGNPQVIGEWIQGSSDRPFRLVDPPRSPAQRDLHVDYVSDLAEAASGIVQMARGKKSLVFVETVFYAEHAFPGKTANLPARHPSCNLGSGAPGRSPPS